MNKMSLTRALLVAGAVGMAGAAAQADAIFYPDGTMVELGEFGADRLALDSSIDTTVLGAAPAATVTTTTVTKPVMQHVYVQPSIDWDRSTVMMHMRDGRAVHMDKQARHRSAATFDVPARAGEASTMTQGRPNLVTTNDHYVVGSYSIPHSALTVGQPYYVMSF